MKFGEKLKALRTDKGISQKALSDQTGISLRAIQNYETKDILPKSRDSYDALARALDVEVSTLLDENVEFVKASDDGALNEGVVTWTIRGVEAGKTGAVTLTVKVYEVVAGVDMPCGALYASTLTV